jgi:CubicO group peptidase (beta-lactamase class C family)
MATTNFKKFLLLFMLLGCAPVVNAFEWVKASPESQGMSSSQLKAVQESLAEKGTKALLVIRHDRVVLEWYASDYNEKKRHYSASLAKAMVGGMSLALAMDDGLIHPDDMACTYIPEWKDDPLKSKITIRHLATHTAGVEDAELSEKDRQDALRKGVTLTDHHMQLPGWKGAFWRKEPDPFTLSRDQAPIVFQPGTQYAYSNPGMALLSYAITASLQKSPFTDIRSYLRTRIMEPIGVEPDEWSIGYGQTYDINGLKIVPNWGGGAFTARAVARVGRLLLQRGQWDGHQILREDTVREVMQYSGMPKPSRPKGNPQPASGLAWYTNFDGVWENVPRDAFAGAGAGNQVLLVIPSLDMILVRNGSNLFSESQGEGFWGGAYQYLFQPIVEANIQPPYPKSELITVEFAPEDSILRLAQGSDNWPVTWGDDDDLYTAYGDGWGFVPKVEKKLSLGLCKVSGYPPAIKGINLRSSSGETLGQGAAGVKASGMLMVDGVLYMVARNARNSTLAWSSDHGETWEWADWRFTESFGCPTFLNFGQNYAGARDEFVYLYSNDDESAYDDADQMVMARVHQTRLKDKAAYQFFAGFDSDGNPTWARDVSQRKGVFHHPGRCGRSGITYNPYLKRYLWCQVHPNPSHVRDERFDGGFGMYEAPEPWGPWKTVFFTTRWDVGPGETSSLPTKWMQADGTCHLLFSGDDCFSVRALKLIRQN